MPILNTFQATPVIYWHAEQSSSQEFLWVMRISWVHNPMHNRLCTLFACAMAATLTPTSALELAAPFVDHMILQRGQTIPVWGFDKAGAVVTIEFAGQSKTATADVRGEWMLELEPLDASVEGRVFKATNTRGASVELRDVLVGEVWHASGQSNMEWFANKSLVAALARDIAAAPEELPIREFRTDTVSALYPQKRTTSEGGWKTSRAASGFSALALSFAHTLHQELGVPIGILLTSHSNTRIEAFTERKAIEAHPLLNEDATMIHDGDATMEQGRAAFAKYKTDLAAWQQASAEIGFPTDSPLPRPNLPGIAGQWRGPSQFFNGKIAPIVPFAIRGSIWCQGTSNSADGRIYAARMEALVRGWRAAWNMPEMPFYFTQMQPYGGGPDPDNVGFADIRQAQHLYFKENREHTGMVVQIDLNSANPGGIHYANKLHPGMRLARWALAKDYGKSIPHTGPIYSGHEVKGSEVIVSFESESLFGGLMVGSKGQEKDFKETGLYVEPARATPGEPLNHFRLCGEDRVWHAAEARIVGDRVIVTSSKVPSPIGVQYAYNAVPVNANLYNQAGLPATPFAAIHGELIFQEVKPRAAADQTAPFLSLGPAFRPGIVLQRDQAITIWGFANPGTTLSVTLGTASQSTTASDQSFWSLTLPAMSASAEPQTLGVKADNGRSLNVPNLLVGDVWFIAGTSQLTSEMAWNLRDPAAEIPELMPLVREFRRKSKASTSPVPRKRFFEIGGDQRFRSSWQPADASAAENGFTQFAYHFAKALDRPGIPQGFVTMSSGMGGRTPQMSSPLSWTSYAGLETITRPSLRARVDALRLRDPSSDIARKAISEYLVELKSIVEKIAGMGSAGADLSTAPLQYPAFPDPERIGGVPPDAIPAETFNWCVNPFTPMAISGVIWVPGEANIGHDPADYAAELEAFATSLPETFGREKIPFYHALPSVELVDGITIPNLPMSQSIELSEWPKSLKEVAIRMAGLVE